MPEFIVKAEVKQIKGGKKGIYTPRVDILRGNASEVAKILDTKYSHPVKAQKGFTNKVVQAFTIAGNTMEFVHWCLDHQAELEKIRLQK